MSAKPELLIVNEFHADTIAALDRQFTTHHLWRQAPAAQAALLKDLTGRCRLAASASWRTDPAIYDLPGLEVIACFGVGVDGIDFAATGARGIRVSNTPTVLNDAVADIGLALILMTRRQLLAADAFVRRGAWTQESFPFGRDLAGSRLGILGFGAIGAAVARRAEACGMRIAYHNRRRVASDYPYFPDPESLAANSDVLLSLLPGGASTRGMIGAREFSALGPQGTFINIGRGSTVDEAALIAALENGQLGMAGLDVYADEPRVSPALRALPNVVLLPHIGSATVETRRAMGQLVIDNLLSWEAERRLITPVDTF